MTAGHMWEKNEGGCRGWPMTAKAVEDRAEEAGDAVYSNGT